MKLIIDIDDKVYNDLKNRGLTGMLTSEECECMNKSIYNGTPLEKYEDIIELYLGMSESMQKAVKDVMIVTQEKK